MSATDINPFWQYSLQKYNNKAVKSYCLNAQNKIHANVNVLLFSGYVGCLAIELSSENIEQAQSVVDGWHRGITQPLRAVRLNVPNDLLVKSSLEVELLSEQVEQDLLYHYSLNLMVQPQKTVDPIKNSQVIYNNLMRYIEQLNQSRPVRGGGNIIHNQTRLVAQLLSFSS